MDIMLKSRGIIRFIMTLTIESGLINPLGIVHQNAFNGLYGDRQVVMKRLVERITIKELSNIIDAIDRLSYSYNSNNWFNVCSIQEFDLCTTENLLFQMADDGLISYSGNYDVGFVHPADIWTCFRMFHNIDGTFDS